MRRLVRFQNMLRSLFRRRQAEADLEQELRDHLEREIENNLRAGMPAAEAKFAAQRLIGPVALYQEECRDARGVGFVENLARDLSYAIRMLRRAPLFTGVAILTLAVGIGANTTVFTFVENILLRSLPIQDPQQVDSLNWGDIANISYPNYVDFRDRNTAFSGITAYSFIAASLSIQPRDNFRAWGYEVTGNYFQVLGVRPALGRLFSPQDDDKPGAHPLIVLSHHCWQTRFGADPQVIGRSLKVNGYPLTIIGVAAPSFTGTELLLAADYWVPLSMLVQIEPGYDWTHSRTAQNTMLVGRRKPGVSRSQAEANLNEIAAQIVRAYPNDVAGKLKLRLSRPGLLGQSGRGMIANFGAVLMGVSALGLLLACVNLAGMLLARASDRRREIGIRLALGAGRTQLIRQLMTESLLLAVSGGAVGLFFVFTACRLLNAWHPAFDIPIQIALHPNPAVLSFTLAAVLLTTILFGLAPALQATRVQLVPSLKNEAVTTRFRRWSPRDFLVTAQIALSVMLVICSVLVVRSLQHALTLQLGFNPNNAASVSFHLTAPYNDDRILNLQAALLAKLAAAPGIQAAAVVNNLPLRQVGVDTEFIWRAEVPKPKPADRKVALVYNISPGYLHAAGTVLLSGRDIDSHDRPNSAPVVLVNQTFAHLLFGAENPLRRRVRVSSVSGPVEIIGVVEDGKYISLGEDTRPALFFPFTQLPTRWTTLVARSPLPAAEVTALLRKTVLDFDPEITLFATGSLKDQLALPLIGARMAAVVLGIFGAFAMALAATGLFALMSYAVSRRTREIGIRMALGAKRTQVLSSILGRTLVLCIAGISIGAILTLAAGQLLSSILYGISPHDPATYCTALLIMFVVALLACWSPAARAIRIDPVRALREE